MGLCFTYRLPLLAAITFTRPAMALPTYCRGAARSIYHPRLSVLLGGLASDRGESGSL